MTDGRSAGEAIRGVIAAGGVAERGLHRRLEVAKERGVRIPGVTM